MPEQPLVSIIIPTFNRAHLIGETLDSVLAQTYQNWECIVVDDGSTDGTEALVEVYIVKDVRFQYHKRPDTYLPGGNGARNYGFDVSKGDYIQWFDSDDVMLTQKLEVQVASFLKTNIDFVISKSKFLNSNELFYHYNYDSASITFESFAMGNVSWVTDDFMIRRKIAANIRFNEDLRAGQEYNYCCKMLLITELGYFINDFLTLRRQSENSIGSNRKSDMAVYLKSRFEVYWLNYLEISNIIKHVKFEKFSLMICASCYLRSDFRIKLPRGFKFNLFKVFGFRGIYFSLACFSKNLIGRYYFFYKHLKRSISII